MRASIAVLSLLFLISFASVSAREEVFLPVNTEVITADNINRLEEIATIGEGWQRLLSLSPDGNFVAMRSEDGIRIYDVQHPQTLPVMLAEGYNIWDVAFSPDWSWIALYDGQAISLISMKTGHRFRKIEFHSDRQSFNQMLISPNGHQIAIHTGWDSGHIDMWWAETGEVTYPYPDEWDPDWECRYSISNPLFSQDSHILAYVCGELDTMGDLHSMNFWEFIGGSPEGLEASIHDYPPHVPYQLTEGISSENVYIGTGFWVIRKEYGLWRVWDLVHQALSLEMPQHYEFAAFRPKADRDDEALFYDTLFQRFVLLNLQTQDMTPLISGHRSLQVVWNAEGSAFVVMEDASTLRVVNLAAETDLHLSLGNRIGEIHEMVFNHDGTKAYFSEDRINIRSLDLQTGQLESFASIPDSTGQIAYDPVHDVLAVGTQQGTIELWDVSTGQRKSTFKHHDGLVKEVLFSVDGEFLASYGADRALRVRALTSNRLMLLAAYPTDNDVALAFDPQTPHYLAAFAPYGSQSKFTVYDVKNNTELIHVDPLPLLMRPNQVVYRPFSSDIILGTSHEIQLYADGLVTDDAGLEIPLGWQAYTFNINPRGDVLLASEILSWTGPSQIAFFDPATGKTLHVLPDEWWSATAFSPDGRLLMTSGSIGEGRIRFWGIPAADE